MYLLVPIIVLYQGPAVSFQASRLVRNTIYVFIFNFWLQRIIMPLCYRKSYME